jgi:two-component system sensor histidine kinase RegB
MPQLYKLGILASVLSGMVFLALYVWRLAKEARQMTDALAATEMVLAREQQLHALDGLAAAAAHELGTPMSTISVIARELERAFPADSPHADDVKLLREQAARCREILGKLTELSSSAEPFPQAKLSTMIEEVVAPHRHFGIHIDVTARTFGPNEPDSLRNPAIIYGLGNLIENAVDFARQRVGVETRWDDQTVSVTISDDGPGFAPEVIGRLGEPYVTTRGRKSGGERDDIGLGLGLFIAKTLLERSGATLSFANKPAPQHGTIITVRWPRADFQSKPNPAVIA